MKGDGERSGGVPTEASSSRDPMGSRHAKRGGDEERKEEGEKRSRVTAENRKKGN